MSTGRFHRHPPPQPFPIVKVAKEEATDSRRSWKHPYRRTLSAWRLDQRFNAGQTATYRVLIFYDPGSCCHRDQDCEPTRPQDHGWSKGLHLCSPVNKPLRTRSQTSSRSSSSSTSVSNSPSESSEEEERGLEALEWVRPSAVGARTQRMHPRATNSAGFHRPKCCDAQGEPDWGVGIAAVLRLSPEPRWYMHCCIDIARQPR